MIVDILKNIVSVNVILVFWLFIKMQDLGKMHWVYRVYKKGGRNAGINL